MIVISKSLKSVHVVTKAILMFGFSSYSAIAQPGNVPAGSSAQVVSGEKLYQQYCSTCHGVKGRDATVFPRPIWGDRADLAKFATTRGLFEYLQMLMPFDDPSKINDEQKTSIVAFMAVMHGSLKPEESQPHGGNAVSLK
jgi:mono/diheme cytochrome c family protein